MMEFTSVPAGQAWMEQSRIPYPKLTLLQRHAASVDAQPNAGASASMLLTQSCLREELVQIV